MTRDTRAFDDTDAAEALRLIAQAEREAAYRWQRRNDRRVGDEHGPPRQGIVPVPVGVRECQPGDSRRLVSFDDI